MHAQDVPSILSGASAEKAIKAYLLACSRARIAVAYWGSSAVRRFDFQHLRERTNDFRIVCDLMSGCCNPDEVRQLIALFGPGSVRTQERLHAKVWITDVGLLLGSSNASANGHGHEGKEAGGLIEANLAFPSPSQPELASWETWFENRAWAGAQRIEPRMMEKAQAIWEVRRAARDGSDAALKRHSSLLAALRDDPGSFEDKRFKIYIYEPGAFSAEANRGFDEIKQEYKAQGYHLEISAYENWPLEPGTFVLDFHLTSSPAAKVCLDGFWKVLSENSFRQLKNTSLTLCTRVTSFEGMSIGGQTAALNRAALRVARARQETDIDCTITEFSNHIDERS